MSKRLAQAFWRFYFRLIKQVDEHTHHRCIEGQADSRKNFVLETAGLVPFVASFKPNRDKSSHRVKLKPERSKAGVSGG
jgi:hypothetical protein